MKIFLLAFVSVLLFGTILIVAVYTHLSRNETEYAFLWMQPAASGADSWGTATYKDGILYAPSKANDMVYAVNASNGEIIWNKHVRTCTVSPCIDGDVIYVSELLPLLPAKDKPRAIALNRTTGKEIWHFADIEPDDYSWVGDPLVCGDYVYYTTWGSVYALNKTNGNLTWHQNIDKVVCVVACHDGVIFVSAIPGQYAFNATTGESIWHVNYGSSWDSSPVIYDGMVIQACRQSDGRTNVLNETTGELIRTFWHGTLSTPLVHDDKVFIPTTRVMYAFDLMTGDELWRTVELHDGSAYDRSYCSPAGACGAIYYQSFNGTFYVIDEVDGSILWSYELGGLGYGSPSIGDGCVFITNDAGLYAFRISPDVGSGDWPQFCQNNLHISYYEHDIEHVEETAPPPPPCELYAILVVVAIVAMGVATLVYGRKRASATTIEVAKTVLAAGFEYVTEKDGIMLFSKPKRFVSLEI